MKHGKDVKSIGLIYNLKPDVCAEDLYEEYDEPATIEAITGVFKELGFTVVHLPFDENFFQAIASVNIDFAFNIAEGIGSSRTRESQIPCILESLSIPYSGSDALAIGITLDKYLTHQLLKASSVDVPALYMVEDASQLISLANIFHSGCSYIVKPRWEGSSKGIFLTSLVSDYAGLEKNLKEVINTYRQPAVVEEFLPNDEVTVAVCGYKDPYVLGMMKIEYKDPTSAAFIYSLEVKRDWQKQVRYVPEKDILQELRFRIQKTALKAYRALELRDISRIDFRVSADGIPKIIDVNPLPGLSEAYSDLPILFRLNGGTYKELITLILKEAFCRYDISFDHALTLKTAQRGR